MISKERVRHMTKLASFEERERKECEKMAKYFRRDYVGLEMLKSCLTGTAAFAICFGVWLIGGIDSLMSETDLIEFGTGLLIRYLVFLACYLLVTYIVFNIKYTRGRKKLKMFYNNLKQMSRLYEADGAQHSAEDFDSF